MRIAVALLAIVFFSTIPIAYGQQPVIQWQKIYGGPYGDYAHSIQATADGGFIVGGYTEGNGGYVVGYHGNLFVNDYWIVKLDRNGSMEWQRCLGGTYFETGVDIRQTPDGGYLVAGTSASLDCDMPGNKGALDYWMVKINSKGDTEWQKHYGGSMHEYCYGLDLTSDGGFVVVGHTESSNGDVTGYHAGRDFWIVKADANGNIIWQKAAGGSGDDEAMGVRGTPDGGCIVTGASESKDGDVTGNHNSQDWWVVKLSSSGQIQWQKSLGGSQRDYATDVELAADGGYVVAGHTSSGDGDVVGKHDPAVSSQDFWVVKLNTAGALQWSRCYGGNRSDWASSIKVTPDGGYVLGGIAESFDGDLTCNGGVSDMWVIKINSTGNLLWQKNMGGSNYDEAYAITALSDGSVVAAGVSCSPDVYGQTQQTSTYGTCGDFWIVKLVAPPANNLPIVTINPTPARACGGKIEFEATVEYAGTNPVFQWTKNGAAVGTNSPLWNATGLVNNDQVTVRVTSGGACHTGSQESFVSINVQENTNITQPQLTISTASTAICGCEPLTFTAQLTNGGQWPKYRWLVNGIYTGVNGTSFTSTNLKAGDQVTCVYKDKSICMPHDSVVSNTIMLTTGNAASPTVTINTNSNPSCVGSTVEFVASAVNAGAHPTYQWKVNGMNVGTNAATFTSSSLTNGDIVTCTVTKDPGYTCVSTPTATSNAITMNISQPGNPSVTISASATNICIGTSVTFTATAVNAGKPTYEWKINGVHVGGNTVSLTTNAISNGDVVSCDIIVDPSYGCANAGQASSNEIAMTVSMPVPPTINISVTANDVCAGNTVIFTASAQNAGANPTYQWMVNGSPVNNSNSATFASNSLSNGDQVYCMVTPAQGVCSPGPVSSNTIAAIIHPLPQVTVLPADTIVKAGSQVQLRAVVTGNIDSYAWSNAGKLMDATQLNPITIPLLENTSYSLSVTSDMGCPATAVATIRVGRVLAMPNAFTPNNDGLNDVFRIPPAALLELKEFSIFDRWGNKVFTTSDISKGWDGTFKGQKMNAGVYVFMVTGADDKGKVNIRGTVTLVR